MICLLTTGLQLGIRDTETAPEELFFEVRKPPEHGVILKYTAEFQGPMATGRCFLCHWPVWRVSCSTVLSLRQEEKQFCGTNYEEIFRKEKFLVLSPLAEIFGTSVSAPPPTHNPKQ